MRIEARAPTRIDLAGGTLDLWPLYLFHPGAVTVNCAITRFASCVLETGARGSRRITLTSLDTGRKETFSSLDRLENARAYRLPLLARLVRFFRPRAGLTLTTTSEAPAGSGLGGSSAMAIAICAALDRMTGSKLAREDWIHISRDIEAAVLGVPTGTQDHYPPAFGSASAIHLETGGERREELRCDLNDLERRLVLCYTGEPLRHGINNWEVFSKHINGDARVRRNLAQIAAIARQVRAALIHNRWDELGRLVREEWEFRRHNLPGISTPKIDRIVRETRRLGALGAKVCGAGGGGCVALVVQPGARARVEAAIIAAGAEVLACRIARRGVQVNIS